MRAAEIESGLTSCSPLLSSLSYIIKAIGIDKEEGYEKDGHQIKILKHNANLALFLLANDQSVDQGSALADGNDQEES